MRSSTRSRRAIGALAAVVLLASGLTFVTSNAAVAATGPWNETSAPPSRTNSVPSGTVKTLNGDLTGDGVPDQVAITSTKKIFIGTYTAPGTSAAITWSEWTPPSISGLSASTIANNTYVGAGDPLRRLTGEPDPVIRDGLTIIVPSTESGTGQPQYWYFHSYGTGFEAPDKSSPGIYLADKTITGDFNGDGRMDFLLIDNTALTWKVVKGSVDGTTKRQKYEPVSTWLTGYGLGNFEVVGDFDGSGIDSVAQLSGGSWRVARGSATTAENTFTYSTWLTGVSTPNSVIAGDFTGTGYDSLIATFNSTSTWDVLVSGVASGSAAFTRHPQSIGLGSEKFLLPADWNADGLTDVEVITSGNVPKVVRSSFNPTTQVPTLTLDTSSLSLGTVNRASTTYYDGNDSADLFLETSTGNYFVTADNADLSSTRVVHLNRPLRSSPAPTVCTGGTAANLCGYFSDRAQFYMPHRAPYYVRAIDFTRAWGSFTARSIGDSCFYIYPHRYPVGATDDLSTSPNREENCNNVEKGTGVAAFDSGPVSYPGNGILVPSGLDGRVEVQGSAFTTAVPGSPLILRFTMVVGKASASPSNLGWVLRLPEADVAQPIPAGSPTSPTTTVLDIVPFGGSPTDNHTEWGNTGTCNQFLTRVAFYNSFDQSVGHTEATFALYVKHPGGAIDNYSITPTEFKGVDGTASGSYTSRNEYVFSTPVTIAPGDIVGVTTTHVNYGTDSYNADAAYYLAMQKATDVSCSP